jgi:hypothetical protein
VIKFCVGVLDPVHSVLIAFALGLIGGHGIRSARGVQRTIGRQNRGDWNPENGNGRWRSTTTWACRIFGHKSIDDPGDRLLCARLGCHWEQSMVRDHLVRCEDCENALDPDWCHCGDAIEDHRGMSHNHSPVPMGCTCGYALPETGDGHGNV